MRSFVLVVVTSSLLACEASPPPPPQVRVSTVETRLQTSFAAGRVRLLLGDDVLASGEATDTFKLQLPDDADTLARLRTSFFAEVTTPCGPVKVKLKVRETDRKLPPWLDPVEGALPAKGPVFVDNRDEPAHRLSIGQQTVQLSAGQARGVVFYKGSCAEADAVKRDDVDLGVLPARAPKQVGFIDVKGGRCYRSEGHVYAVGDSKRTFDPKPRTIELSGAQVYVVDELSDFMKQSPQKFTESGDVRVNTVRRDLYEVPCPAKKR